MKKKFLLISFFASLLPLSAFAEVRVNVNVGLPVPVVHSTPPPVVYAAPPTIVFEQPPVFLAPGTLGFYVGVESPYDIVYASNSYYLYYGNVWYRAGHYNGPWRSVRHEQLPYVIRRHGIESIRSHRDLEYRSYHHDHNAYRGRSFRPGRAMKREVQQERRHDREERQREKREWKEEHHDNRGHHKNR